MNDFNQTTEPDDEPSDPVDRLVADYVRTRTEQTDTRRLVERVRCQWLSPSSGLAEKPTTGKPAASWSVLRRSRRVIWPVAAAVAILAAFIGGRYFSPTIANATGILHQVHSVHLQDVDRCYRVQFAPDSSYWDGKNALKGPSDSILWTRGDRFWADVRIGTIRLTIGRNEDGMLWASPTPKKGIRFADEQAEMPEEVAFACSVNSMSLPTLVEDVLADFDLRGQGPSSHADRPTNLIWATLKPGHSHRILSAALLEIDAATDVIVRLVLWTVEDGEPKGTVTFTLIDSDTLQDDQYRLESHLDEDAEIRMEDLGPAKRPAGNQKLSSGRDST